MNKRKQYEKAEEIMSSEIFDKMRNDSIFKVERCGNDFCIVEMCDEYFCVDLTKEMCQELSKAFGELADCFDDAEGDKK